MFDSTVFVSTYLALIAAFATMEVFSFCLGMYLTRRQMQRQQEFEKEFAKALAEGKMPMGPNPMGMVFNGGMPGYPMPPTVSGEGVDVPQQTHGQYL